MIRQRTVPKMTAHTYVLTAAEVVREHFRGKDPAYLQSEEFRRLHPTFPQPRSDGLYHRRSVEAWSDSTFGIIEGAPARADRRAAIMEAARRGPRQGQALKAS